MGLCAGSSAIAARLQRPQPLDMPRQAMNRQTAAKSRVASREGMRAVVDRWLTAERVSTRRGRLVDLAVLGSVLGIAALSYWWTRAPLYNPPPTIDPWLYTALFVNFDQVYPPFSETYYAARLPWVVPGRILYSALSLDAAYWVLHGLAFCGGVAAVFFLVRRYLGLAAAVVGAATLALSPLYWNAQYWDYVDGVSLTYALGGLCFGLPLATGRVRAASLFAAGVCFAAAVTTNPFVTLIGLTYPIKYAILQPATGLRQRAALALIDLVALLFGVAALVISLGFYARSHGGPFRYYAPQLDYIRGSPVGDPKVDGYEWLRNEPKLLVPIFLLILAVPLLAYGRRLPPFRFAAAAVGGLAFLTAVIYAWEFFAGGIALQTSYYFSYFAGSIALTVASLAALAVSLAGAGRLANVGVAFASTVAAVIALGLIFESERAEWTASAGARISIWLMAAAAAAILLALVTRRTRGGGVACVVAIGAVAFASHFAVNSSSQTFQWSATQPDNRSVYHAAVDNVAFVNEVIPRGEPMPRFWYAAANRPDFIGMQSMYFYAFTAIGYQLPQVGSDVRQRLDVWKPRSIVLLCETRNCRGATAALRRVGYPYREVEAERISHGRISLWTLLVQRSSSPVIEARCDVYRLQDGDLLRALPSLGVYAFWAGRKHAIPSIEVLHDLFGPNAMSAIRNVLPRTLRILPSGRTLTSARVWAKIKRSSKDRLTRPPPC